MGGHEGRVALGAELRHIGAPKEVGHAGPGLGMSTEGLGGEAEDALQGHSDGLVPPLEEGFAHSRGSARMRCWKRLTPTTCAACNNVRVRVSVSGGTMIRTRLRLVLIIVPARTRLRGASYMARTSTSNKWAAAGAYER